MYEEILNIIRQIAPEFAELEDEKVTAYIDLYADLVSKKYFGKHYNKAVAFFIAHWITFQNMADEAIQNGGGAGDSSLIAGNILMEKEGDLQRQYGSAGSSNANSDSGDELLSKTYYGKMYLALRSAMRPVGMMRKCP